MKLDPGVVRARNACFVVNFLPKPPYVASSGLSQIFVMKSEKHHICPYLFMFVHICSYLFIFVWIFHTVVPDAPGDCIGVCGAQFEVRHQAQEPSFNCRKRHQPGRPRKVLCDIHNKKIWKKTKKYDVLRNSYFTYIGKKNATKRRGSCVFTMFYDVLRCFCHV